MSFGELIFLAFLALMVFGPQKLPEIARTAAKIMAELRRASNEFRYSLEEEIRALDVREQEQKRTTAAPALPAAPGSVAQATPRALAAPEPEAEASEPAEGAGETPIAEARARTAAAEPGAAPL